MADVGPIRFDDVVEGAGRTFDAAGGIVRADALAEVPEVLAAVDEATRAGAWAAGFVSYEAAPGLDPALSAHPRTADDPPLLWLALGGAPRSVPAVSRPARAESGEAGGRAIDRWLPGWSDARHRADVETMREHIARGDVFQCTLTTHLCADLRGDPQDLYGELAANQHGRYAAYLDTGRHVVASASPELFFRWSGDRLLTRPMKGTAARGGRPEDDRRRRTELLTSVKERAENVIIVDLLRNDVSRIARVGTVTADRLCVAEPYGTVWQLTSDISGVVPATTPLTDVFRALFPCGSVTGAPKPRATEIIRAVEPRPRGVYCGAIGWVAPPTEPVRAQFSVAIRTAVADRRRGTAVYGTGGGITWGSDPDAELAELITKARILPGSG